jgi:uncharacterized membrane protein YbhN (UPF0104 family)
VLSPGRPAPVPSGRAAPSDDRSRRTPHRIRWTRWLIAAAVPAAFLVVPPLSHLPARLVSGCATWVAIATALELASALGFVVAFALVFGRGLTARESLAGGLRALGASTILPGGSLVGPAVAARAMANGAASLRRLAASTIAFTILTTVPGVAALALTGITLGLGWLPGPHGVLETLPAAAVAVGLLALTWSLGRSSGPAVERRPARPRTCWMRWVTSAVDHLRDGGADARRLLLTGDWKLLGAVAYYAFDNAVLWASFRAYGSKPAVGVIMMGYLVGSLGSALPIPAGLGAVDGGLLGALVLYGAPLAPAAAAVILYRGISLGLAVALGGCGWVYRSPVSVGGQDRPTRRHSIMRTRNRTLVQPTPSPATGHPSE